MVKAEEFTISSLDYIRKDNKCVILNGFTGPTYGGYEIHFPHTSYWSPAYCIFQCIAIWSKDVHNHPQKNGIELLMKCNQTSGSDKGSCYG